MKMKMTKFFTFGILQYFGSVPLQEGYNNKIKYMKVSFKSTVCPPA